ncbi:MAG: hydrophobic protein [Acidimicrobiia bacterium]|nr:hydrophobic protein [Acidimicrobiia bacterium]MBV8303274.1 hydrophobic protein [Acidimicrobiia bacterium]
MGIVLLALLLVLLFGGLGFAVHVLWLLAAVLLVLWVIGFVVRGAEGARWYRW